MVTKFCNFFSRVTIRACRAATSVVLDELVPVVLVVFVEVAPDPVFRRVVVLLDVVSISTAVFVVAVFVDFVVFFEVAIVINTSDHIIACNRRIENNYLIPAMRVHRSTRTLSEDFFDSSFTSG